MLRRDEVLWVATVHNFLNLGSVLGGQGSDYQKYQLPIYTCNMNGLSVKHVIAVFEIVGTREFRRVEKMVARTAGISLKLFPNGNTTPSPQFPMLVCPSCGP